MLDLIAVSCTILIENGETVEYHKREDMENVIAISNESKWHQTEGGSQLLTKKTVSKLGNYGEGP